MSSGTRWLTDDEQRTWRAYLRATQQLQEQLDRELQREAGVPLAYYQILAMLSEAPARMLRMSDLAALTWSSRSRLSHAVDRLEEHGWVERRRCPGDRRGALAVLTDAGLALLVFDGMLRRALAWRKPCPGGPGVPRAGWRDGTHSAQLRPGHESPRAVRRARDPGSTALLRFFRTGPPISRRRLRNEL